MNHEFMDRLEALRNQIGKPMVLSSAYRCPVHNAAVSGTGDNGPHTTGRAVDVLIRGTEALRLVAKAIELGFTGIGVKQKGGARFIHLDDLHPKIGGPRPWIWSY
jgi:uncharacterized protein YcbK (DUF882 family)